MNPLTNISGVVTNLFGKFFGNNKKPQGPGQSGISAPLAQSHQPKSFEPISPIKTERTAADIMADIEKEMAARYNVQAPALNLTQLQAQARKAAQGQVNPYYTKLLNTFAARQKQMKSRAVEDKTTGIARLESALQRALELSDVSRERTTEDVTGNLNEINAQEDFAQTTEGTEFDRARRALAGGTAQAGLTTSGLGKQAESQAISDRNVLSKEQARQVNVQKQAQETFRTRTFADLERADKEQERKTTEGKSDIKLDFDRYIQDLAYQTKEFKTSTEKLRAQELVGATQSQQRILFNKFIEGIQDPYARQAALNAYGSLI